MRPTIEPLVAKEVAVQIVLNSKFFRTLSVGDLGAKARALGFDGLDIIVRPGHPVNPDNVATALPAKMP